MVGYEDKKYQQSWPLWRFVLMGLNMLALVFSIIMSWHYLKGGTLIGCGSGNPCEQILNSQWSTILGVLPVSGLAVSAYLTILLASFFIGPVTEPSIRRIAWSTILILVGAVAVSAVWFTIIQIWIIKDLCFYCMTTHIAGMLLTSVVIWRATKELDNRSDNSLFRNDIENNKSKKAKRNKGISLVIIRTFIGVILAGILIVLQVSFTPSAVYSDGKPQQDIPTIDYHSAPIIGSPDAPFIVTLLFDYQCPHCQKLHLMLNETIRRFDNKIAFVLCPTPLNNQCNPYIPKDEDYFKNSCELAKIGLAVWTAKREVFSIFENWMFTFESGDKWYPRSVQSAKDKAIELVGKEKFDAVWNNPWIEEYMQTCIQIYGQTIQNGKGVVPKLIYGSRWVVPEPNNADDLVAILNKSLSIPTP